MGWYVKGFRSLGGGRWVKVSRRGLAVGQRLGRVGPFAFGVHVGTHRRRRPPRRVQVHPRYSVRVDHIAWTVVFVCAILITLIALAS